MGLGVWEEVFEPQIFTNEAVIGEKIAMDLAGKVIITSNKNDLPSGASLMSDFFRFTDTQWARIEPLCRPMCAAKNGSTTAVC